ncbi:MAG: histone deacetylase [Anaerolineales bacterium]
MKTYYSDKFILPLPPDHRFPIDKYSRLRQLILEKEVIPTQDLRIPEPASFEQIGHVHQSDYIERVFNGTLSNKEIRRIGFPWSPELVERSRRSVGGTIAACRAAFQDGVAVNLAGGTHHAHADFGSGYCVLNDCAIAARTMQCEGRTSQVLILDCDVHQGDGTAAIFSSDPSVFTFSIHGARNFPFRKEYSDLDLALEDGTSDEIYLETLQDGLVQTFSQFEAGLVIYLAGADPYFDDRLGRLALTKDGLGKRDRLVYHYTEKARLPLVIVMAGGYARDINDTVDIHINTVSLASKFVDSYRLLTSAN